MTPPPEVLDVLDGLTRPSLPAVRWTTRDQWHVTLRFLGSVPDEAVGEVVEALAGGVVGPACTATLGPAVGRYGQRVLHVPVVGLDALAAQSVAATAGFGEPPDPRPFSGHLTLARGRRGADLRPLTGTAVAASWPVDEARLYRSELRPSGARYSVVRAFPLGPAGGA